MYSVCACVQNVTVCRSLVKHVCLSAYNERDRGFSRAVTKLKHYVHNDVMEQSIPDATKWHLSVSFSSVKGYFGNLLSQYSKLFNFFLLSQVILTDLNISFVKINTRPFLRIVFNAFFFYIFIFILVWITKYFGNVPIICSNICEMTQH